MEERWERCGRVRVLLGGRGARKCQLRQDWTGITEGFEKGFIDIILMIMNNEDFVFDARLLPVYFNVSFVPIARKIGGEGRDRHQEAFNANHMKNRLSYINIEIFLVILLLYISCSNPF